jgi:hypothetical protein
MTISMILLVIAFICFVASAANIPVPRVNIMSLGLAFWVLSLLVGR